MRFLKSFRHFNRIPEVLKCYRTSDQWFDITRAYLGIKALPYPYLFQTKKGQKILLNTFHDLLTVWVVFMRGEYIVNPDCKLIVDAGANIGSFSIFAAAQAPHAKIIALEPFPNTLELLKNNIRLNNLESRVKIIPFGLGSKDGVAFMDSNPDVPSQSIGTTETEQKDGIRVPIKTLKTFFREEKIEHLDLFKMDIEGAEHPVISSSGREEFERVKRFSLEYHPNGPFEKIHDKLKSLGFELVGNFHFHQDSGVAWFERK